MADKYYKVFGINSLADKVSGNNILGVFDTKEDAQQFIEDYKESHALNAFIKYGIDGINTKKKPYFSKEVMSMVKLQKLTITGSDLTNVTLNFEDINKYDEEVKINKKDIDNLKIDIKKDEVVGTTLITLDSSINTLLETFFNSVRDAILSDDLADVVEETTVEDNIKKTVKQKTKTKKETKKVEPEVIIDDIKPINEPTEDTVFIAKGGDDDVTVTLDDTPKDVTADAEKLVKELNKAEENFGEGKTIDEFNKVVEQADTTNEKEVDTEPQPTVTDGIELTDSLDDFIEEESTEVKEEVPTESVVEDAPKANDSVSEPTKEDDSVITPTESEVAETAPDIQPQDVELDAQTKELYTGYKDENGNVMEPEEFYARVQKGDFEAPQAPTTTKETTDAVDDLDSLFDDLNI